MLLPSRTRPGDYSGKLSFSLSPRLSGLTSRSRNPDGNPVEGSGFTVFTRAPTRPSRRYITGELMFPYRPSGEGFVDSSCNHWVESLKHFSVRILEEFRVYKKVIFMVNVHCVCHEDLQGHIRCLEILLRLSPKSQDGHEVPLPDHNLSLTNCVRCTSTLSDNRCPNPS